MPLLKRPKRAVARAGIRGLVAAMAMTGTRTVTSNIGLINQSPPAEIIERHAPTAIRRLQPEYRAALTELAHWSYGISGGVLFSVLPRRLRTAPWTGPVYGLLIWAVFEAALAPALGIQARRYRGVTSRIMVAADHALYGIIVAGQLAPEPHQKTSGT